MNERKSRGGIAIFSSTKRLIFVVILALVIVLVGLSIQVLIIKKEELIEKSAMADNLRNEIIIEDEKAKNLDKGNNKVSNNDEIEALARQELGLIKRDEIIIKPR